jgi:hypothetical protein
MPHIKLESTITAFRRYCQKYLVVLIFALTVGIAVIPTRTVPLVRPAAVDAKIEHGLG